MSYLLDLMPGISFQGVADCERYGGKVQDEENVVERALSTIGLFNTTPF